MFSAHAVARSDEYRAKQITSAIGRTALSFLTKGISSYGTAAYDAAKAAQQAAKDDVEQKKILGQV